MTAREHIAALERRKARVKPADAAQLGLFDAPAATAPNEGLAPRSANRDHEAHVAPTPSQRRAGRAGRPDPHRTVAVEDMPHYPAELHEAVDRMLADLRADRVLLTYRAIKECFGISRATVARRVKEGLVPGVRMAGGRVLDDGPVRRFDRMQLRWLLLAVRFARRQE